MNLCRSVGWLKDLVKELHHFQSMTLKVNIKKFVLLKKETDLSSVSVLKIT